MVSCWCSRQDGNRKLAIAEQVMQELFKMLAMHYEFSLAGIEEAATTD